MNTLALEEKDPLFWASLEEILGRNSLEIEAMALDWLYEVIIHTIQKNPPLIVQPADTPLIIGALNEGHEYLLSEQAFRHSHLKQYSSKPQTVEGLKEALRSITSCSDKHIVRLATHLLRRLTSHARRGRLIVRRSGSTYIQITDSRFPFPSMQQRIDR